MSTTAEKKGRAVKQPTMEKAIEQLVILAKDYAYYAKAKGHSEDNSLLIKEGGLSVWVYLDIDVWFVKIGDVEITTNGHKTTFPYRYTTSDLTKTYKIYSKFLEELNANLKSRTENEIAEARRREIERLKERLKRLESGASVSESSPF